jgi:hypothetical protein
MELNTSKECAHETAAERALIGTLVMDEVRVALQNVYHVIEVYEMYEHSHPVQSSDR